VLLLKEGRAIAQGSRREVLTADNLERAFGAPFAERSGRFEVVSRILPGPPPGV
jgi:ABC-type cobalamin transport system ATPase subunit